MRYGYFLLVFFAVVLAAQQAPFIQINAPNVPKGGDYLLQDSRGGIWLSGCESGAVGLSYFDGSRFFNPVKNFPKIESICSMAEDGEGGIWLASGSGLYRVHQGQLQRMFKDIVDVGVLTKIAPDVLVTTVWRKNSPQGTLVRISNRRGSWKTETLAKPSPSASLQQDRLGNLLYECSGRVCSIPADQILNWRPGTILHIKSFSPLGPPSFTPSVWRDTRGCFWIHEISKVSYQCPGDREPNVLPAEIASVGSPQILELSDGSVVIAGSQKLAIGRPGAFRVLTPANGYPSVGWGLVTKDDTIWLSNANGLFVLPSRLRMEFWTERDGLDGNTWSVLRSGSHVFAIAGDSVRLLERDRSRWRLLIKLPGASYLSPGPDDTLFASSHREGVIQADMQGRIIRRSGPVDISMLATTPDGTQWGIGERFWRIGIDTNRLHLQSINFANSGGWGPNLQVDASGNLWLCHGQKMYEGGAAKWRVAVEHNCTPFAVDRQGTLWCDDPEHPASLEIWHKTATGSIVAGAAPKGSAASNYSHFLAVDRRNWLWRGTTEGVYVASPAQALQGDWLHLDRSNGLPAVDTNQRSFFEDTDGSVWIGADNSVIHLSPAADFLHPTAAPDIFISAFSIDAGAPQMADLAGPIKSGSAVAVCIGSLTFDRRNSLRIRYRLLPGQKSWRETNNLEVVLGKLPSGSHTLEVQGCLFTGPWSSTVSRSFGVLQPVWFTWPLLLAYVLSSIALSSGSWIVYRLRKRERQELLPNLAEWRLESFLPELHDLAGTVLNSRYEVGAVLARGGFANVMAGYDQDLDRRCAIKVFRNELKNKASIVASFEREVSALQQICHSNVVSIYAHGNAPSGAPYLVMEFVDGRSLREVLETGALKPLRIARLLRQLAGALDAIHSCGIYHRDIKPENIILRDEKKKNEQAVLIDFSIAIVKDANESLHGISRAAGTFDYMAPEQVVGGVRPSGDIYSLAKVVIEMLIGERLALLLPNAALELPSQAAALLRRSSIVLSEESVEMLVSSLEFDPARRPESATTFAAPIIRDLELLG